MNISREEFKDHISIAYERGVRDAQDKFFVDRKPKTEQSYTVQSSQLCLLESAKRNLRAGYTSVAIEMILAYLVNEHGK